MAYQENERGLTDGELSAIERRLREMLTANGLGWVVRRHDASLEQLALDWAAADDGIPRSAHVRQRVIALIESSSVAISAPTLVAEAAGRRLLDLEPRDNTDRRQPRSVALVWQRTEITVASDDGEFGSGNEIDRFTEVLNQLRIVIGRQSERD